MPNPRTPEGVASYPNLFTPRLRKDAKPGDAAVYSLTVLFDEAATQTPEYKALQQLALKTAFEKFGDSDKTRDAIRKKSIKLPFIVDERVPDGYRAMLRLSSENAPGVVDRYLDPDTGKPKVITDPKLIYPGARVIATVGSYAYEVSGNRGVSFGLRNVQKRGDGERIDGHSDASKDFDAEAAPEGDIESNESAPSTSAEFDSLLG